MGCNTNCSKREIYSYKILPQEKRKISNNLSLHLKQLERDKQTKSKVSRRGRWEGGSGWGPHVNPRLIHVNVWQKPLQYWKVISLQLTKINGKKEKEINHKTRAEINEIETN